MLCTRAIGSLRSSVATARVAYEAAVRSYASMGPQSAEDNGPEKSVFISQSSDIHTNLALEDWLYKKFNFDNHRVLLLWKNDPCVVIGRHQNPFLEVDMKLAEDTGTVIARRNSGGGTVYHDQGNLNCTFFSPRKDYNRKNNLKIICRALNREFKMDAEITPRENISLNGYKISGTASKLGKNAYHHCTVLVDADGNKIHALLSPNTDGFQSNATESVREKVTDLKSHQSDASMGNVLTSIGYEFLRTDNNGNDGGDEMIGKQLGFHKINPTNGWFPGLDSIRDDYKSWEWNHGRSPEFCFSKSYPIQANGTDVNVHFDLKVTKGLIRTAVLKIPSDHHAQLDSTLVADLTAFVDAVRGRRFDLGIKKTLEDLLYKRGGNVSLDHRLMNNEFSKAMLSA